MLLLKQGKGGGGGRKARKAGRQVGRGKEVRSEVARKWCVCRDVETAARHACLGVVVGGTAQRHSNCIGNRQPVVGVCWSRLGALPEQPCQCMYGMCVGSGQTVHCAVCAGRNQRMCGSALRNPRRLIQHSSPKKVRKCSVAVGRFVTDL